MFNGTSLGLKLKSPVPPPKPAMLSLVTGGLLLLYGKWLTQTPQSQLLFLLQTPLVPLLTPDSGLETRPKSRDLRGDRKKDGMMETRGFTRVDFSSATMGNGNNPEKPDRRRPISGDQQIQFGTKHNFHGLKSAT